MSPNYYRIDSHGCDSYLLNYELQHICFSAVLVENTCLCLKHIFKNIFHSKISECRSEAKRNIFAVANRLVHIITKDKRTTTLNIVRSVSTIVTIKMTKG